VLSGGGSRASFHLGALRYLYDHNHIAPQAIVSTSAGSIVGSMLAQFTDPAKQSEALRQLDAYWLAMNDTEEMFTEQSWFTRLRERWTEIVDVLPEPTETEAAFVDANDTDAKALLKDALYFDPSIQGDDSTLSMLWQIAGSLPRLGRVGADLASSLRGAERAASAYRPGPIAYRLLFESGFSAKAVRTSGMQLRLAMVGLKSGDLHFMRQDGIIVDREGVPVSDTVFDLPLGVWASCAIPGVFRPVKLGDELYVDGGVRETVPVEMAVTQLGVTKPYVIVATPPGVSPQGYEPKDLVSIILRSFSIVLDETLRDEVAWARQAGATVIEPLIDVHGSQVVESGLLHINRDYGWMRAAEEMTGTPAGTTGDIVAARLKLYHLLTAEGDGTTAADEQASPEAKTGANGKTPKPATTEKGSGKKAAKDPNKKATVTAARKELRRLIEAADPQLLPDEAATWPDDEWVPPANRRTVMI